MEPNQTQQKSNGALIGSVIIVIILIVGGIYLWQSSMSKKALENNGTSSEDSFDNSATATEAEINAMDLESLDEDM